MEIETQRDNRVCLEDFEWRKWIGSAPSLLTAPLLALFIMIAPAQAAVESVPAINAPPIIPVALGWYTFGRDPYNFNSYYLTSQEACAELASRIGPGEAVPGGDNPNTYVCFRKQ